MKLKAILLWMAIERQTLVHRLELRLTWTVFSLSAFLNENLRENSGTGRSSLWTVVASRHFPSLPLPSSQSSLLSSSSSSSSGDWDRVRGPAAESPRLGRSSAKTKKEMRGTPTLPKSIHSLCSLFIRSPTSFSLTSSRSLLRLLSPAITRNQFDPLSRRFASSNSIKMEHLLVKKLSEHATLPVKGSKMAAGFDLCR